MPTVLCMPHEVNTRWWILMYCILEKVKPTFFSHLILLFAVLIFLWRPMREKLLLLATEILLLSMCSPGINFSVVLLAGFLFCCANSERVMQGCALSHVALDSGLIWYVSSGEQNPDTMTATRSVIVYTYDSIATDCESESEENRSHITSVIDSTVSNLKKCALCL